MPLSVVLSDPSRIGCELLKRSIEEHAGEFSVVDCVTTVRAMVDTFREHAPDLVLVSASLEDGPLAGFHALRQLGELRVASRAVMLVDSSDREAVIAAFRGGAKGVFVRDEPVAILFKCMRRVHEGQIWANSEQLNYLLDALGAVSPLRSTPASTEHQVLTAREQQIANLVVQGFSNRDISRKLNLSEHTVKNYLFRIFDKLGISTRVELAMYMVGRREIA